ncbi:unnamed protein product, partial [Phaeothamnion confervicola]
MIEDLDEEAWTERREGFIVRCNALAVQKLWSKNTCGVNEASVLLHSALAAASGAPDITPTIKTLRCATLLNLGWLAYAGGATQYHEALGWFTAAVEAGAQDPICLARAATNAGMVLLELGRGRQAASNFRRAISVLVDVRVNGEGAEADPAADRDCDGESTRLEMHTALEVQTSFHLAQAELSQGRYDSALDVLEHALFVA